MKKTLCITPILSVITLGYALSAAADPTSLGVGVGWTDSPYKKYSSNLYPIPHIDYDNGSFFIDDLSAGAYIYHTDNQSISIGGRYLTNEFKPHDSSNHKLKKLDKRYSTLLAEIEYNLNTSWGSFSSNVGADVLDESNSILVNADYTLPVAEGDLILLPTIGINWANSNHNNYYYGISHKESNRSKLRYHNANNSFTPYAELGAQYKLTNHFATYGGIHIDKLTGDAADSPMVDNSAITSIYMGVSYNF